MSNNLTQHGVTSLSQILDTPAKEIAEKIAISIRTGEADEVTALLFLKKFKKISDLFFDSKSNKDNKDVKEILEESILQFKEDGKKSFTVMGCKITEASRGVWIYSETEDPYLQKLKEIEAQVKELRKLRETHLQTLVAEHNAINTPHNIVEKGITPFVVTWDKLPILSFEEGYGEINTNPPYKINKDSLRFSV